METVPVRGLGVKATAVSSIRSPRSSRSVRFFTAYMKPMPQKAPRASSRCSSQESTPSSAYPMHRRSSLPPGSRPTVRGRSAPFRSGERLARLDAYIELLFQEPGSELVMETGASAILRSESGSRPVLRQPLTTPQIVGAFSELMPPEVKAAFPGQGPMKFRYVAAAGEVIVRLEAGHGRFSAVVAPARKPEPKGKLAAAQPAVALAKVEEARGLR